MLAIHKIFKNGYNKLWSDFLKYGVHISFYKIVIWTESVQPVHFKIKLFDNKSKLNLKHSDESL